MSEAEVVMDDYDDDAQHPASPMAFAELGRMVEAIIFASSEPVSERALAERLPVNTDLSAILEHLQKVYEGRGVHLVRVGAAWAFRTASDLGFLMSRETVQQRKLSRAAMEVLAIIAYHQPVTRAELEDIRGVETSKGTLDVLMETGWIKLRGRRRTPGRPVTYGTTDTFLDHFGLPEIRDLPGLEELRGAGLLSARIPSSFSVPVPNVDPDELTDDEEPLEDIDLEGLGLLAPRGD
ncbi:SMC-Scp complex subunit ScpB [Brucella grignonensis]|uniref:Segregation and condensation protein B n=1 Tax=Brucella grignonensis TaxID=94627 RepID=A0A256F2K6_9HYPH|nr:SMC-Scp complex subunit ScpB [Brucella grignonensis]NKB83796.1 SMC-Scp complex subunit ScpB [Brucella grignonensis]OYR09108.1 segregation and condensation protein B [Brucella grignonensis]